MPAIPTIHNESDPTRAKSGAAGNCVLIRKVYDNDQIQLSETGFKTFA